MRNLKRALSLALASVMLLGMMVVGTSAASYPDIDAADNLEAIEVLKAVGVMEGDENGNFNPDNKVTRNEMAVVMANLLNLDYNYYQGTTTFADVPAWAAPYVAACQANGIIAGISATEFGGSNNVTAAQAGLMMMKALGYFQYAPDFGDDWQLATVRQASKIDLYDGINAGAATPLTRNQVAQLALNALEANMVEFNGTIGTDITTSDGTSVTVGYNPKYDPYASTKGDYTPSDAPTGDGYLQLAEELYGADLKKYVAGVNDDFGRPANKWTYTNKGVIKTIGTFPYEATLTYTKAVKEADVFKDLGLTGTTKAITRFVDGTTNADTLNKGDDVNNVTGSANGALTEVFVDDTGVVTVTVVNTYIGEVVSVTNATATADRYVTIAGHNATAGTFETEDFAKEDIVLYTYSNMATRTGVKSVALAEKVTGQLTGYAAAKSLTVDGKTYEYAAKKDDTADGSTLKIDVDVYLDSYGYAIDVANTKVDAEYAYVLKYTDNGGVYGTDKVAQLLLADGTKVDVNVKAVNNGGGITFTTGMTDVGLVSYTVDSNDKYTLTGLDAVTDITNTKTLTLTKGNSTVTLDSVTPTPVAATANGKTIFLVVTGTSTDPVYTSYTGIANVPSISITGDGSGNEYAYYTKAGETAAKMIYIDARNASSINSDATEIVYIVGDSNAAQVTDADGSYYVYKAVVDGEITTIKVDATLAGTLTLTSGTNVVYKSVNYNDKGIVNSVGTPGISGTGTDKEANGTIGLNNAYYAYDKDVKVFYLDKKENAITTSSIGAITKDTTDTVKFVLNSSNKVVAIFIEEVSSPAYAVSAVDVYVDGVKATLAGGATATSGTISGAMPTTGKVITIKPTVSPMATSSNAVTATSADGAIGAASYTVTGTDVYGDTVTFTITVVAENGTSTTATYTLTLGQA